MPRRITLFLNQLPYPDDHGAKVDIWRRIIVIHSLGYHLQLICWSGEKPSVEHQQKVEAVCDQLILIPIYRSFLKKYKKAFLSFFISFYPAEISTYTNYKKLKQNIKKFNPDILWLETYTPGLPALKIAKKLSLPLVYRSHNIEHHYAKDITTSIPKLLLKEKIIRWFISCQLENFEKRLIQRSHIVFDISTNDLKFWKNIYPHQKITWLPPLAKKSSLKMFSQTKEKTIDFLFVGNLFTKNNIFALKWLINEVMPLVHKELPPLCSTLYCRIKSIIRIT